jgi:hypothetical protein
MREIVFTARLLVGGALLKDSLARDVAQKSSISILVVHNVKSEHVSRTRELHTAGYV